MNGIKKISDKICFVSVDVEADFDNPKNFRGIENLEKILNIFKKYNISSTLFITGEVLEKYPNLIKEWSESHEIACHGFTHTTLDKLNLPQREKELIDFLKIYSSLFEKNPFGFRSPRFVIDEKQFLLLEKYNFLYDSSVLSNYPPFKKYPGFKGKAPNIPYFPSSQNYLKRGEMKILEIPVSGLIFGIPLVGTWISKLPLFIYRFLFSIKKPQFLTLNLHSWDSLNPRLLEKIEKILKLLKNKNYQFLTGERIYA